MAFFRLCFETALSADNCVRRPAADLGDQTVFVSRSSLFLELRCLGGNLLLPHISESLGLEETISTSFVCSDWWMCQVFIIWTCQQYRSWTAENVNLSALLISLSKHRRVCRFFGYLVAGMVGSHQPSDFTVFLLTERNRTPSKAIDSLTTLLSKCHSRPIE